MQSKVKLAVKTVNLKPKDEDLNINGSQTPILNSKLSVNSKGATDLSEVKLKSLNSQKTLPVMTKESDISNAVAAPQKRSVTKQMTMKVAPASDAKIKFTKLHDKSENLKGHNEDNDNNILNKPNKQEEDNSAKLSSTISTKIIERKESKGKTSVDTSVISTLDYLRLKGAEFTIELAACLTLQSSSNQSTFMIKRRNCRRIFLISIPKKNNNTSKSLTIINNEGGVSVFSKYSSFEKKESLTVPDIPEDSSKVYFNSEFCTDDSIIPSDNQVTLKPLGRRAFPTPQEEYLASLKKKLYKQTRGNSLAILTPINKISVNQGIKFETISSVNRTIDDNMRLITEINSLNTAVSSQKLNFKHKVMTLQSKFGFNLKIK